MELDVLFEDNHLLVVHKPAGLLVQGDRSGDPTLLEAARNYLKRKYGKPGNVYLGLVHRLDRNVSGVVVLARTSKAAGRLSASFRAGEVTKVYLAVVRGTIDPPAGTLSAWLAREGDRRGVTRAEPRAFPGAVEAHLEYHVRNSAAGFSLVEIRPATGRRHQIRAQLALAGHPLLGDVKYGAAGRFSGHRIALHALKIEVVHPVGAAPVTFEAPLPDDWPWPPGPAKAR